ncbi:MAG: VIT1/CCC1 transporter family protein [Candidatus Micrarchaeota archaeon]
MKKNKSNQAAAPALRPTPKSAPGASVHSASRPIAEPALRPPATSVLRPTAKPAPKPPAEKHLSPIHRLAFSQRAEPSLSSHALEKRHHDSIEQASSSVPGLFRQIVLGGQDGLVNVLGILLGVAAATSETRIVIISGIAAAFAESLSMAAVAYTSARAAQDHYWAMVEQEKREIKEVPDVERKEVEIIYYKKGFRGAALKTITDQICSDEKLWLETMMHEELGLYESEFVNPYSEAFVVGLASFVGSFLPLIPFLFLTVGPAMPVSVAFSLLVLALAGALKAKITTGSWWKSALEMALVGGAAALGGYLIGSWLGVNIA